MKVQPPMTGVRSFTHAVVYANVRYAVHRTPKRVRHVCSIVVHGHDVDVKRPICPKKARDTRRCAASGRMENCCKLKVLTPGSPSLAIRHCVLFRKRK